MDHDLERYGMGVGWFLIAVGNALQQLRPYLGTISIVIGIACQLYTTWLRHHYYGRRTRRRPVILRTKPKGKQ